MPPLSSVKGVAAEVGLVSPRYHRDMRATMYMRRCLELAEVAARAGEPVGAIVVCGDEVVAEGVERTRSTLDPTAHAEIDAIRQSRRKRGRVS